MTRNLSTTSLATWMTHFTMKDLPPSLQLDRGFGSEAGSTVDGEEKYGSRSTLAMF